MMTWGLGSLGWLWMLGGLALMVGVLLVVIWAIQRAGVADDDAMAALRTRFARGEIDATQFEESRRILASSARPRGNSRIGMIGLLLVVGALVAWIVASASMPAGWNWGWGGMLRPGG